MKASSSFLVFSFAAYAIAVPTGTGGAHVTGRPWVPNDMKYWDVPERPNYNGGMPEHYKPYRQYHWAKSRSGGVVYARDDNEVEPEVDLQNSLNGLWQSLENVFDGEDSSEGDTENEVIDKKKCKPLTFIFARGTGESGNMGAIVGPQLAKQLREKVKGGVLVQGVKYPASVTSNLSLGVSGGPELMDLMKKSRKQCPDSKIAISGYSQGAMVVHNALLESEGGADAAVAFGDPLRFLPFDDMEESEVMEICNEGDPVCLNGANPGAHLTYDDSAEDAADFIIKTAGV